MLNSIDPAVCFANSFLIAMPSMADPTFAGSVIYVCQHNENGAMGLIINRPTDLSLQTLFERIDLKLEIAPLSQAPVFYGGPVQTERGFVLHEALGIDEEEMYSSSIQVTDRIRLTTSRDVLQAISAGMGPQRVLIALGYAGWGGGQLEQEIAANGWLTVPADPHVLFDLPPQEHYAAAIKLLGFDPAMLSSEAGHA
jgi:putative transcriptional regulator